MNNLMLIDDDEMFNFLNKRFMSQVETINDIQVFISAQKALNHLKEQIQEGKDLPDLILLDIRMPLMSGFDFLDEILEMPEIIQSRLNVVMLSSSLDDGDMKRSFQYPMVKEFINKPLDKLKLQRILNCLNQPQAASS